MAATTKVLRKFCQLSKPPASVDSSRSALVCVSNSNSRSSRIISLCPQSRSIVVFAEIDSQSQQVAIAYPESICSHAVTRFEDGTCSLLCHTQNGHLFNVDLSQFFRRDEEDQTGTQQDKVFEELLSSCAQPETAPKNNKPYKVRTTDLMMDNVKSFHMSSSPAHQILITLEKADNNFTLKFYKMLHSERITKEIRPYHTISLQGVMTSLADVQSLRFLVVHPQVASSREHEDLITLDDYLMRSLAPEPDMESPLLLFSSPGGNVFCTRVPSTERFVSQEESIKLIYQLDQDCILMTATRLKARGRTSSYKNAIVVVGISGKVNIISSKPENGSLDFSTFYVPGPITSASLSYSEDVGCCLVHATLRNLYSTSLQQIMVPFQCVKKDVLTSVPHRYCNIIGIETLPFIDVGQQHAVAFTRSGKLLELSLILSTHDDTVTEKHVGKDVVRDLLLSIDDISREMDKLKSISMEYNSVLEQLALAGTLRSTHMTGGGDISKSGLTCSSELIITEFGHDVEYKLIVTLKKAQTFNFASGWTVKISIIFENEDSPIVAKVKQVPLLFLGNGKDYQRIEYIISSRDLGNLPFRVDVDLLYSIHEHLSKLGTTSKDAFNQLVHVRVFTKTIDILDTFRGNSSVQTSDDIVMKIAKSKPQYRLHYPTEDSEEDVPKGQISIRFPSSYMLEIFNKKLLIGGRVTVMMLKPLFEGNALVQQLCEDVQRPSLTLVDSRGCSLSLSVSLADIATGTYELLASSGSVSLLAEFHSAVITRLRLSVHKEETCPIPKRDKLRTVCQELESIAKEAEKLSRESFMEPIKAKDVTELYTRLRNCHWYS